MTSDAQRTERLEINLAHQQRLVEQLNEVVTEQAKTLMRLQAALPKMHQEIRELRAILVERSPPAPQEKPPHY